MPSHRNCGSAALAHATLSGSCEMAEGLYTSAKSPTLRLLTLGTNRPVVPNGKCVGLTRNALVLIRSPVTSECSSCSYELCCVVLCSHPSTGGRVGFTPRYNPKISCKVGAGFTPADIPKRKRDVGSFLRRPTEVALRRHVRRRQKRARKQRAP